MINARQLRETRLVELVETHNLALSLTRLKNATPYDSYRWRQALYHALAMSGSGNSDMLKRMREAMELP